MKVSYCNLLDTPGPPPSFTRSNLPPNHPDQPTECIAGTSLSLLVITKFSGVLNNLFKILLVFKTVRNWKISQLIPIEVEKSSKLVSVLSYGEYRLLIHVLQRCGTDTRQCIISELFCHKVPNQYEV